VGRKNPMIKKNQCKAVVPSVDEELIAFAK
jgi:hypothetical protein